MSRPHTTITIEIYEHGMAVTARPGGLPVPWFNHMIDIAETEGWILNHPGIAGALGATFVFGSAESLVTWKAEIDESNREKAPLEAWLAGHDRGVSSNTIVAYLTDAHVGGTGYRNIPADDDDFGRCYRLLKAVPALRRDLPKMGKIDPRWAPLVENWVELERLWEEEHPFGTCPKLYARMKELTG